jgi:hypothetical protein
MTNLIQARASIAPIALLVTAAIAASGAGSAGAEPPAKVLVLPFDGDLDRVTSWGRAPPDGLERLTAVVARSAGITGAEVSTGQASYADTADLMGCGTVASECLSKIAEGLGVDQVVTGAVEASDDGRRVTVSLRFYKDGEVHEKTLEIASPSFEAVVQGLARDAPDLFVGAPERAPEREPEPEPAPAANPRPEPIPATALAPPPPVERDTGFGAGRVGVLAWSVAGLGVAAAGGGAVFLWMARDRQQQVDGAPTASAADLDRLEGIEEEGERFTRFGNALLIGGSAALVVGSALIVYQGLANGGRDRSSLAVAPALVPGGAGINLSFEVP